MKTTYIFTLLFFVSFIASAQSVTGTWITMDENGDENSIVTIYEDNDMLYANILDVLDDEGRKALCTNCKDENINKPIVGLMVINGLKFDGKYYRNGTILNPETGKSLKCRLSFNTDKPDIIEVRSYLAFNYTTQYWKRMML